jgi:hypothetical protein
MVEITYQNHGTANRRDIMPGKTLKELIVEHVDSVERCKEAELASWVMLNCGDIQIPEPKDLSFTLKELVKEKKLVRIVYCLLSMDYRDKNFYFPAKTEAYVDDGI